MTTDLHRPPPKGPRGHAKRCHKPLPRRSRTAKAGWSPERRAKQAELIRALKPWQKSTGPRTDEGRARASSNALKHGFRSRPFIERVREERRLIRDSAQTIALAKLFLRSLQAGAISGGSGVPCRSCGAAKAGGGIPSSDHELSLEPDRLAATPALV